VKKPIREAVLAVLLHRINSEISKRSIPMIADEILSAVMDSDEWIDTVNRSVSNASKRKLLAAEYQMVMGALKKNQRTLSRRSLALQWSASRFTSLCQRHAQLYGMYKAQERLIDTLLEAIDQHLATESGKWVKQRA
jgi:hypothetical protein